MEGRSLGIFGGIVLFLITLSCSCARTDLLRNGEVDGDSATYSVRAFESRTNTFPFLFACGIWAEVSKGEKIYADSVPLVMFDDRDCNFTRRYPRIRWIDDNVVQFASASESAVDNRLVVTNASNLPVRALRIDSGDIFLIMDIQPFQTISLEMNMRSGGYISAYGVLDSDQRVAGEANFRAVGAAAAQITRLYIEEYGIELTR